MARSRKCLRGLFSVALQLLRHVSRAWNRPLALKSAGYGAAVATGSDSARAFLEEPDDKFKYNGCCRAGAPSRERNLSMKKMIWPVLVLILAGCSSQVQKTPVTGFSTAGHTVYDLRPATVEPAGGRVVITAAYDGSVLCYRASGELLWQASAGGSFPLDMAVADIDGDNLDETLIASADGSLYAIDHDGQPLWKFVRTPPLYRVCVARSRSGAPVILTGGVEQVLYALSPAGKILRSLKLEHVIRHLRAGNILGDGRQYAAVSTATSGLSGDLSLLLIAPENLKILWRKSNLGSFAHNSGKRFFSMVVFDRDGDGKEEIILSNSWGEHGHIFGFNYRGDLIMDSSDQRIPSIPYRMNLLSHVKLPDGSDEFLLGLFGNILIVYNTDGSCREVLKGRYAFSNGAFDPETAAYYMGSSVSGGDGVYALHLDRPGWRRAFETIRPAGKLARIERNLAVLKRQVREFRPPAYQQVPRKTIVVGKQPAGSSYEHVAFVSQVTLSEKYENRDELWCRYLDRRRKYDHTADEIIAIARRKEQAGEDFIVWAGHGRAVYMRPQTLKRMLDAAPGHLQGFLFAEMEQVDRDMREVVRRILLPLAEQCRRHGEKKIIFLNKNIFWNGSCYLPLWKEVLLNRKYRNVFVPALEETNSRTQEQSLMGRVGLWLNGSFDHWSCRAVTDNAVWDRMWEWSSQQVATHQLRQLVSRASLGADIFFVAIHQGEFSAEIGRTFLPFYEMLEKGILQVPARDELLSVPDVFVAMKTPPSPVFIAHGINGHRYNYPRDDHSALVFDRLDCYWGGAPLPDHDLGKYGMGVSRRMCNFLPKMPFGLIAILPDETGSALPPRFREKISTDGQFWFDDEGRRREPGVDQGTVEAKLRESADRLPLRVTGDVSWSTVRINANHVRVVLVDSGYLDPADREAEILLQHVRGVRCMDILSGKQLRIENNRIRLRVPAGTLRICDISSE